MLMVHNFFKIYLFKIFWQLPMAHGTLVIPPGIKPAPPALEGRVLTTGQPG